MKKFHVGIIIRNILYDALKPLFKILPSNTLRVLFIKAFQIGGGKLGKHVYISKRADIKAPWKIIIGDNEVINKNVVLDGRGGLTIGSNVDIAQDTFIWTAQHDYNDDYHKYVHAPVVIEDYVWLSSRSMLLPGVTIGRGVVVAAGAVVTKNVEPMKVAGGVPAKTIADRKSALLYTLHSDSRHN